MPYAISGSTRIHYDSTGAGAPVLLVMGLGMNALGWWRTVPVLARSLRVLAFDNRGVGRSDRPPGPYTLAKMSDDAVAVLDAAGEPDAHVYGISLGGMIAQKMALRHPARVRSLVLGATTAGGPRAVPIPVDVVAFLRRREVMPAEEAVWASVPYNYGPRTRREAGQRIAEDVELRLRHPIEPAPYAAQLAASLSHDAGDRLREVQVPALVMHGELDRMIPPGNAELLTQTIPGAVLRTWPEAGHLYTTDEPDADQAVAAFLSSLA